MYVDQNCKRGVPLYHAISHGHPDEVKLLLDARANPDMTDSQGRRRQPLCLAVEKLCVNIVKILLDYGADSNMRKQQGETPLHTAAGYCETWLSKYYMHVVKLLKNLPNNNGITPLRLANIMGNSGVAKILLDVAYY